ncbi:carboxylesterase/lipase family protein [Hymenobacter sp. BRD67]|uniref:carboxylesterase/lipase family protein n=1 Tax=Hymenobacter sp. BRD67 TaxID=2675877 RepID=UPI001563CE44|nr:carboxylesterase family protein [Hymenobacter sp. BRD67]QKG54204.1 carboxylesterase family protein [Hymenobacter sp. BRD67]
MKFFLALSLVAGALAAVAQPTKNSPNSLANNQVQVAGGRLAGATAPSGIHEFKGIPYAAPPVGPRRWQAPQPAQPWKDVRPATQFGPRAMQLPLFSDMNFRSNSVSEDCLYLNVWTGAQSAKERRPVLVYFYGGGFVAGDGSEPRYDGEALARRGIVTVTVNYRLGVFGFLAHPELTKESPHHASGNYGLLDQAAALRWVSDNIAAFGGDPQHITIAGESAGSWSVSAQMASPLAKNLIVGAIGESGSLLGLQPLATLAQAEQAGVAFATSLGASSLGALRALPAQQVLDATAKPDAPRFSAIEDGYFLPRPPAEIYAAGAQAAVPLLVGWNSLEMNYPFLLGQLPPTAENYRNTVQKLYGSRTAEALRLYPAGSDAEAEQSANALASDRFIAYSTWKWAEMHAQTGDQPVYRYLFARPRPALPPAPAASGAVHSAEIEYALGNLGTNKVYNWTADDYKVSDIMQAYFANFIKSGNPNGAGLVNWPAANRGAKGQALRLDASPKVEAEANRTRYLFLEQAGKQ